MKSINSAKQPFLIIFIALIVSLSLSVLPENMKLFGYELKHIDLLSDIKQYDEVSLMNSNLPAETKASIIDIEFLKNLVASGVSFQGEIASGSFLYGDLDQLKFFFDALKTARTKGIRIAHYGDSAIEGDLISADLRESLQSKFGGSTVGHLGIVSQDITFRTTTKHTFSPNNTWITGSLYGSNSSGNPLGISGEVVIPQGNAWVRYEVAKVQRSLRDFSAVRIYYANAKASAIKIYFNDSSAPQSVNLVTGPGVKELLVKCPSPSKSVKIEFPIKDQAHFYGVSLENDPGLYLDNFPLRGNSGVDIQKIPAGILKDYAKYLDYKLIILEFGLNLAGKQDYAWYEREMGKVISHLKLAYPKASILMISVHDKAVKQGSNFVTDPSILRLLETQMNIAKNNKVGLFNLFEAMGGKNSMNNWVKNNPPLASMDYVHFNVSGAKKVADLIVQSLMNEYNKKK